MAENRARSILQILQSTYKMPQRARSTNDPFRTLVVTIISQNTAGRNTSRAFEALSKRFKIKPEALAKAETNQIEQCLKVAGLYRNKARTIRQVSRIILDQYHGNLGPILSQPLEQARRTLLQLPGIGPKTADVVLLFSAKKPTVPVDTHVNCVSRRLGLAPAQGDYEKVRESLQRLYKPTDYLAVHLLLIQHGRKFCKARDPLCKQCPLSNLCPSQNAWNRSD